MVFLSCSTAVFYWLFITVLPLFVDIDGGGKMWLFVDIDGEVRCECSLILNDAGGKMWLFVDIVGGGKRWLFVDIDGGVRCDCSLILMEEVRYDC